MTFVDTHFHLDLWKNSEHIIKAIEQKRIYTIAVTNAPSVFHYTWKITQPLKYIRPALGFHPELAAQRANELPLFREKLTYTRYVGEIGLDYSSHITKGDKQEQKRIFATILESCAAEKNKILTIHSRKAEKDIIDMIGNNFPGKVILHWFSGSTRELLRAIDNGFYFSINMAMIRSQNGQKIIKQIPTQQLLTESDGPFIQVQGNPNSPLNIEATVNEMAKTLQLTPEMLMRTIFENFKCILNF